jgi:hypothetical protein
MKAVADISITSRFLQPRGPGTPIVITATVSPALGSLRDGDSVQAALSPGALDTGSYASTAGAITAVSATVTINGAAAALADVVRFDDVVNVSITVSDAAGNTRDFNAGTQTVQGIAPTLAASDSLSGRTLTITVDSTTGVPAPVTALTALTLDGVEVRGDATGSDPWTYEVPDSADGQTVAWTVEASNVEGSDTASGSEAVAANLFAPTITSAPQITGDPVAGETVTITNATASGTPTPTVTPTLALGGTDVTGDMAGGAYQIPPGTTVGTTLTLTSVASNGISPDAQDSVSVTVQDGVFTPADLFTGSETGVVYDVSDLSSMNTEPDQSGSVPAVGDVVRFIADKSGNGNDATSPTFANSPVLRQDGNGNYYLEFDGAGDELVTQSNINVSGNSTREYIGGFGPGGAVFTLNIGGNNGERWTVRRDNGNLRVEIRGSAYVSGLSSDGVVGARLPGGGTLGDHVLSNGTTDQNASGSNIVNTGIGPLYIGRINNNTWGNAEFYGCTFIDKLLTAQQRGDARQYYAEKRGVVL